MKHNYLELFIYLPILLCVPVLEYVRARVCVCVCVCKACVGLITTVIQLAQT